MVIKHRWACYQRNGLGRRCWQPVDLIAHQGSWRTPDRQRRRSGEAAVIWALRSGAIRRRYRYYAGAGLLTRQEEGAMMYRS